MKKLSHPLALLLLMLLAIASPAFAGMVNGGFESGLTGWSTDGNVAVVGAGCSTIFPNHCASPTQGSYMALLTAGSTDLATLSTELGTDLVTPYPGGTYGSALWQDVFVTAGTPFSVDWNFLGNDYAPFDDTGLLTAFVVNLGPNSSYYLASVLSVGDYGTSGWQTFSASAAYTGNYRIGFVVFNDLDNLLSSQLLVDNVQFGAVPEPGTFLLLGSALVGLGGLARRKLNL
jgi:hypothetical protein